VADPDHERRKQGQDRNSRSFGVGIWVQYGVILPDNPQLSGFLERVKSERFAGFSGEGNGESEPVKGLFLLHGKHDF
jgi:hypothetical protein